MAGAFTGLFHFVFGKRGPSRAKSAPAAKPGSAPVVEAAPPPEPAPAPAPQIFEPPATPEPTPAEPTPEAVTAEPAPAEPTPEVTAEPAPAEAPVAVNESPADALASEPPAPVEAETPAPTQPSAPAEEPIAEPPPVVIETPAPIPVEPEPPSAIDPNMRLSEHFTLAELIHSDTAKAQKISNLPTEEHLANLRVAAEGMERVRALLGGKPIQVTSGYRSAELNAAVKGSKTSDHLEGFSVDFGRPGMTHYDVVQTIMSDTALMQSVDQLIYEKGRWVHISFAPRRKKEVLTAYLKPETGERIHYMLGLHHVDAQGRLVAQA